MKIKKLLILILIFGYFLTYFILESEFTNILPNSLLFLSNIKHITIVVPIFLFLILFKNRSIALILSTLLSIFSLYKPHLYNFDKCFNYTNNQKENVIKIGTFNLAGNSIPQSEIDKLIFVENLDIIAFQEVPVSFVNSKSFEYLNRYLAHSIYNQNKDGFWTQLTLSKFKLTKNKFLDPGDGFTTRDARITIESEIVINNRIVKILNNHLSIPFNRSSNCSGLNCLLSNYNQHDRYNQLNFLSKYIENKKGNYILIGDFKLSDQNYSYIKFSEKLIDTGICSAHLNYTWSNESFFPIIRLDYIFVKSENNKYLLPISSKTVNFGKSDHLGIVSELKIL
ncbi:hypothetical protein P3G55_22290 [Leptospira sp. 96542]|nr:hypothetical protein [Leptospira sp. 96542]